MQTINYYCQPVIVCRRRLNQTVNFFILRSCARRAGQHFSAAKSKPGCINMRIVHFWHRSAGVSQSVYEKSFNVILNEVKDP
jgi:hypothetical protein